VCMLLSWQGLQCTGPTAHGHCQLADGIAGQQTKQDSSKG
jgi:hypothetical protein